MANFEASDTQKGSASSAAHDSIYSISPEDQASYMNKLKVPAGDQSGNPLPAREGTHAGGESGGSGGGKHHHVAAGDGDHTGAAPDGRQIERLTPSSQHKSSIEFAPRKLESPVTIPHASLSNDAITFGAKQPADGNTPVMVADASQKGPVSPFPEGHTVNPDGTVSRGKKPVDPLDVWQNPQK